MTEIMHDEEWLDPWVPVHEQGEALLKELRREVSKGHVLYGATFWAVGRRVDNDDVLFKLDNQDHQYAVVHLTWQQESGSEWPWTVLFKDLEHWRRECMLPDSEP